MGKTKDSASPETTINDTSISEVDDFHAVLMEQAPDGIILVKNGIIESVNPKFIDITGYQEAELVGQYLAQVITSDSLQVLEQRHKSILHGEELSGYYDIHIVNKDRRVVAIEANIAVIYRDEDVFDLFILRDVSKRRQDEEILRVKESFNFSLFQYNPVPTVIVDREGRVVKSNLARRCTGEPLPDLRVELYVDHEPDHEINMRAELMEAIGTGEVKDFPDHKYGEKTLSITIAPFSHGAMIMSKDITESKRAEEEILQRNRELKALNRIAQTVSKSLDIDEILNESLDEILEMLNITYAGIYIFDNHTGQLTLTAHRGISEELAQMGPSPMIGEGNVGFTAPMEETVFVESIITSSESMSQGAAIITIENSSNSSVFLPLRTGGRLQGVIFALTQEEKALGPEEREFLVTVGHQISTAIENVRLLETVSRAMAAEEADRLRAAFLTSVSHEMRTPMTSIKGLAHTLVQPDIEWDAVTQKDFLMTIDQETDRLLRIVNDVLDMSQIEAGTLKLDLGITRIETIINSLSGVLDRLTINHHLKIELSHSSPNLFVDGVRIGQAIAFLVENAAVNSPKRSVITIESIYSGNGLTLSVSDNGNGIQVEYLDKVFDTFHRIEENTDRKRSGSGLGLAICKGIVERHEGCIRVESECGTGSKFSFTLPTADDNYR
ncbi:MAG: PAS domain S-box protein [Chloroflexi bacterium]|nr:PAS domain S-box protein [Chloroflexota bacterium]